MSKDKKKSKKEKTVYVDDGSTIADMSGVKQAKVTGFGHISDSKKQTRNGKNTQSRFKASLHTYWESVKLMFLPMIITMAIISAAFLIVWLLLQLA